MTKTEKILVNKMNFVTRRGRTKEEQQVLFLQSYRNNNKSNWGKYAIFSKETDIKIHETNNFLSALLIAKRLSLKNNLSYFVACNITKIVLHEF